MLSTSDSVDPIVPPLNSDAPPIPQRTDEMMVLSEESSSLPDSRPKIDLLSTPSSDQLGDKVSSSSVSVGPLYDESLQTNSVIVQSQSSGDQTKPSGVSSGPTYAQPMHPTSSENTVSAPPATEPVVYDEVDKFQNTQVSKLRWQVYMQVNLMKLSLYNCVCVYLTHFRVSSTLCWEKCPHLTENQMT